MVHDWLSHGPNDKESPPDSVECPASYNWPEPQLTILRTATGEPHGEGRPAAYRNNETRWWDASQIYGSSKKRLLQVLTDSVTGKLCEYGKLYSPSGMLPDDPDTAKLPSLELAGVNGNWWLGLCP